MQEKTKRTILGILILINCATIFMFSNQIADDSSITSSRVVNLISEIIPTIKNMQEPDKTILKEEILTPIVRKCAHFSIYAMLGMLTISFAQTLKNKKQYQLIIYSLLFCIFYASTDEFHQYFIPGRSAEIRDVLIDSSVALTGILFVIIVLEIVKRIKKKIKKEN